MFRKREGVVALTGINKNKYKKGKHFSLQRKEWKKGRQQKIMLEEVCK